MIFLMQTQIFRYGCQNSKFFRDEYFIVDLLFTKKKELLDTALYTVFTSILCVCPNTIYHFTRNFIIFHSLFFYAFKNYGNFFLSKFSMKKRQLHILYDHIFAAVVVVHYLHFYPQ